MTAAQQMEVRLSAVENELAQLRAAVFHERQPRPWYEAMVGSMKDFPEFEEVIRLGRAARDADETSP